MSEEHSIQLGPPEMAARAAVDQGWFHDEEDVRLMGFGRGYGGMQRATEALGDLLEPDPESDVQMFGIYEDASPVGFMWVKSYPDVHRAVQVHTFVSKDRRGNGVFTGAFSKLMDLVFASGIYRIEAEPLRVNKAVINALRSMGFKQEGIKRSSFWMDNNDYDTVLLRMLRREWKRIQKEAD